MTKITSDIRIDEIDFQQIFLLFKFASIDRLQQLRNGKIYMKNLEYFVKLEKSTGISGVGDKNEGVLFYSNKIRMYDEHDNLVLEANEGKVSDSRILKSPVFCISAKNIFDNITMFDYPAVVSNIDFDNKIYDDFGTESNDFGVLVITDFNEFINRIKAKVKEKGISLEYGMVEYRDIKVIYKKNDDILFNNAFTKSKRFSHQEEFRILLNIDVDDHFILEIGPISDISKIIDIETIKSGLSMRCELGDLVKKI